MKKILFFMIALTSLIFLVSCDDKAEELVIYSDFGREVAEKETYRVNIFEAFEKEHNVKIRFETLTQADETFDKIKTEQAANKHTTDLLISHFGTMVDYIDAGYMEDLTSLEEELNDRTFLDTFDGSTNKGGKRYFFPINSDVYLSYARKEAFESLPEGLTKADVMAGNYTWEDFINWASELGEGSVHVKGKGESMLLYEIAGMALSNGGSFPKMNDAGNKKAWEDIIAMKDYIHPESLTTNASDGLIIDSESGVKLAFELMTPLATAVNQAPAALEIFPGPKGTDGKAGSIVGGHGIGIVKNAPNRELAEKFIDWFTAPEQIVYAALGTIPTLKEASDELGNTPSDEVIRQGLETVANANVEGLQMISDYKDWAEVKGVYDKILTGIMNGTITLENLNEKLDQAEADLKNLEN